MSEAEVARLWKVIMAREHFFRNIQPFAWEITDAPPGRLSADCEQTSRLVG